jgi:small subunit ribosomal protein S16
MATRLRLQRYGKKGKPYFHLVVADERSPRDGKFIERLGSYNPISNPAVIDINFDRTLDWVKKGAQPSDTVKAILAYKGVLLRNHLDKGVAKGALTKEQADAKFEKWIADKEAKVEGKKSGLSKAAEESKRAALKHEAEVNKAKAAKLIAKQQDTPAEEAPVAQAETPAEGDAPAGE